MPELVIMIASLAAAILRGEAPRRVYPAEKGLSDEELWDRAFRGGNLLAGMSFDEALEQDPRRVYARIVQILILAFSRAVQPHPDMLLYQRECYLTLSGWIRERNGGRWSQKDAAIFEDLYWPQFMEAAMTQWPAEARGRARIALPELLHSFEQVREIAEGAAMASRRPSDREAWLSLSRTYEELSEKTAASLSAIEGPVAPWDRLPGPVRGGIPEA